MRNAILDTLQKLNAYSNLLWFAKVHEGDVRDWQAFVRVSGNIDWALWVLGRHSELGFSLGETPAEKARAFLAFALPCAERARRYINMLNLRISYHSATSKLELFVDWLTRCAESATTCEDAVNAARNATLIALLAQNLADQLGLGKHEQQEQVKGLLELAAAK